MLRLARALAPLAILVLPAAAQSTPDALLARIDELAQASSDHGREHAIQKLELLVFQVGEDSLIAQHAFVALGDLHAARGDWETAADFYRASAVDLLARARDGHDLEATLEEEFEEHEPRIARRVVMSEPPGEVIEEAVEPVLADAESERRTRVRAVDTNAAEEEPAGSAVKVRSIRLLQTTPEGPEEDSAPSIAQLQERAERLAAAGAAGDRAFFREQAIRAYEEIVFTAGEGTPPALAAFVALGDLHAEVGDFETAAAFYQSSAVMLLDSTERTVNERVQRKLERQSRRSQRRARDDR